MTDTSTVALSACTKLVEAASKVCVPAPVKEAPQPHWDALAVSLASQANAISVSAAILGGLALISAVGWAIFVRASAKEEARKAAEEEVRKEAPAIIDAWLSTEGLAVMRQAAQLAQPSPTISSLDTSNAVAAAAGDE